MSIKCTEIARYLYMFFLNSAGLPCRGNFYFGRNERSSGNCMQSYIHALRKNHKTACIMRVVRFAKCQTFKMSSCKLVSLRRGVYSGHGFLATDIIFSIVLSYSNICSPEWIASYN